MLVPETAVYEYDLPAPGKNKIRRSGKVAPMKSESISHGMAQSTHDQFGFRIFSSNFRHVPTANRIDG